MRVNNSYCNIVYMSEAQTCMTHVNCVVFQLIANKLYVLLVNKNGNDWALPGDPKQTIETTEQSIVRSLRNQAGVITKKLGVMEQLYTFDTPADAPQENSKSYYATVTYLGLSRNLVPTAGQTTTNPQFFAIDSLPDSLINLDRDIIMYALSRLQAKITYTNAIFALVARIFTLAQLQDAYQTILKQEYDKRNFRKKFLSLGMIHATDEYLREGAHRPAQLYRFNRQSLQYLERTLD